MMNVMEFRFVSGHIALDLAGTVGRRHAPDRYDLLTDPAALARWATEAGLVDGEPPVDEAELAATKQLREVIYRLARARIDGTDARPGDRDELNRAAAGAPITVRLRDDGTVAREGTLAEVRATVARETVELLGGPRAAQLKACGADPCSRLYVDASRRGDRRWCDMRECGNRAKATAYRRRHSGAVNTGAVNG